LEATVIQIRYLHRQICVYVHTFFTV